VTRGRALYWLVVQLVAIAGGILAGMWVFDVIST
jgi:hypothetical protein